MITSVSICNFKCLRDVRIALDRFTVFVGPNASGKSSILQAIDLLCEINRDSSHAIQLVKNRWRGSQDAVEVAAETELGAIGYRTDGRMPESFPAKSTNWNGYGMFLASSFDADGRRKMTVKDYETPKLPVAARLRLETAKLVNSASQQESTAMAPDGSGLHQALAGMALNEPEAWLQLQNDLRTVIPTIVRLRHTRVGTPNSPALLFDTVGAESVPAEQMSEGTMLVLGLLAAVYDHRRPSLIMLDDIDRGLHPKAQADLIELLRRILNTRPELQILATTHSPYLLDCMDVSEVRMTVLKPDGSTACSPLTSHPLFPKWKDEMAPGEMWSFFGEKWIVETAECPRVTRAVV